MALDIGHGRGTYTKPMWLLTLDMAVGLTQGLCGSWHWTWPWDLHKAYVALDIGHGRGTYTKPMWLLTLDMAVGLTQGLCGS